jgi:pyruvate,orthophosphate dikinase
MSSMADIFPILAGSALAPGGAQMVGNKAWNLMRMAQAGLPVPEAFVLPTSWCGRPDAAGALPPVLAKGVAELVAATGLEFGGIRRPLLVSVRSGAAVSMPGMMETVLDVGLNTDTVEALIRQTGNPRLAWDCFRRLVQAYADVVTGLPTAPFDALVAAALVTADADTERDLDHRDLRRLTGAMLACYRDLAGQAFPVEPAAQLLGAAEAVLRSWGAEKAVSYRRLNGINDAAGTAVTVQRMVFGNAGGASGAGVGFTRNPATGARELYFDFQFDGQGEDVVAGRQKLQDHERLRRVLPAVWTQLNEICHILETQFGDAQDFEFTVQSGVLFLLQTRRAKRTDWAALMIAVDMVAEGALTPAAALLQLSAIARHGAGGEPGRGERGDCARPPGGRALRCGGTAGDPGPSRHGDLRYRGDGGSGWHPDGLGRTHLPCRGRRAAARQGLSRGMSWARNRPRPTAMPDRRQAPR